MTRNKSSTFTYRFDDLPLIIDGAFEDQGITGEAEISYFADGEWSIKTIGIQVSRFKNAEEMAATGLTSRWVRKTHLLDAGTPLFLLIYHRLEHERRRAVNDAVLDQIAEDRESATDDHADMKRNAQRSAA